MKELWHDPIVEEGREAGNKLARSVGYDLHKFVELLRKSQQQYPERIVSFDKKDTKDTRARKRTKTSASK